ncbi:poly(A) RNA polymerase GLD2 isoform X2 [Microplitis demolitor]|uniref:poly(A) RNA polymerase GLD2 isoform X2 n=1 Tax=Microplitis demolitor TaxID=69319 RepID=UPI0004CDA978|nr:poly(A) RNA polymerase GLD2 isoform X2 [Microplitis demolitor]
MYQTVYPSHLVMQILDQQTNRHCPQIPIPPYPYSVNPHNNYHSNRHQQQQHNYHQDNIRGQLFHFNGNQNRQRELIQNSIYPLGPNRRMIVESVSSRRPGGFTPGVNNHSNNPNVPTKNWHQNNNKINNNNNYNNKSNNKNVNNNNNSNGYSVPTNVNRVNSNNGSSNKIHNNNNNNNNNYHNDNNNNGVKKQNYNRSNKRNMQRDQLQIKEISSYGSDSGFSSRSPTPNKHTDSQNESSDDRESIASSAEPDTKKFQQTRPTPLSNITFTSQGFINNTNQYYPNQQQYINYCHNKSPTISPSASQLQLNNYQGKKRNHTGDKTSPVQKFQRARKYPELAAQYINVFPKSFLAPDRYLARANLIEATILPSELLRKSKWDSLSKSIWDKFYKNQQSRVTYIRKMMLWKYLLVYIKTIFPKYGLFLVGSTMNGFGACTSDVDICLVVRNTEMIQRDEALYHLEQIKTCLRCCDFIRNLELIHAKVPILKFSDGIQNLEVDLNCNNAVGVRNTHMLHCYSRIDWRVRPLVLVVKLWAQKQDINDAKNMTISSYSLVLMVIHFLQCGVSPPVLPCLQNLYGDKFSPNSDIHTIDINEDMHIPSKLLGELNHQPLGQLFYEFFKYYVNFDFDKYAVSVRLAKQIPIEECRFTRSWKNDPHQWKCLCVEEPFDLTNTARSVYDHDTFEHIKEVFKRTCETLEKTHSLESVFRKLVPEEKKPSPSKS